MSSCSRRRLRNLEVNLLENVVALEFESWCREFSGVYKLTKVDEVITDLLVKSSGSWIHACKEPQMDHSQNELNHHWPQVHTLMEEGSKGDKLTTQTASLLRRRAGIVDRCIAASRESGRDGPEIQRMEKAIDDMFDLKDLTDMAIREMNRQNRSSTVSDRWPHLFNMILKLHHNLHSTYHDLSSQEQYSQMINFPLNSLKRMLDQADRVIEIAKKDRRDGTLNPKSDDEPNPGDTHGSAVTVAIVNTAPAPEPPHRFKQQLKKTNWTISEDLSGDAGRLKKLSILRERPSLLELARINRNGKRLRDQS